MRISGSHFLKSLLERLCIYEKVVSTGNRTPNNFNTAYRFADRQAPKWTKSFLKRDFLNVSMLCFTPLCWCWPDFSLPNKNKTQNQTRSCMKIEIKTGIIQEGLMMDALTILVLTRGHLDQIKFNITCSLICNFLFSVILCHRLWPNNWRFLYKAMCSGWPCRQIRQ